MLRAGPEPRHRAAMAAQKERVEERCMRNITPYVSAVVAEKKRTTYDEVAYAVMRNFSNDECQSFEARAPRARPSRAVAGTPCPLARRRCCATSATSADACTMCSM